MAKRYLTLDIGASAVKLAEFEGGKGGLTLVNYGIAALAGVGILLPYYFVLYLNRKKLENILTFYLK